MYVDDTILSVAVFCPSSNMTSSQLTDFIIHLFCFCFFLERCILLNALLSRPTCAKQTTTAARSTPEMIITLRPARRGRGARLESAGQAHCVAVCRGAADVSPAGSNRKKNCEYLRFRSCRFCARSFAPTLLFTSSVSAPKREQTHCNG